MKDTEEKNAIVLLQQKDNEAFEVFYDKYAPAIYGVLLSHLKDSNKCSILLQQVFLRFYKELNAASAFPNGIFVCLYRIALSMMLRNPEVR